MSQYWIIAVPTRDKDDQTARKALDAVTAAKNYSTNHRFRIPELKVGTIDSLVTLSDELTKVDVNLTALLKKIDRTFSDTAKTEPSNLSDSERAVLVQHGQEAKQGFGEPVPTQLRIGDRNDVNDNLKKTPREAFQKFRWDRYVYDHKESIDKLRLKILDDFSKREEELRKLVNAYNEVRTALSTQERKEKGSLLVRPISKYIDPKYLVEDAHLTTILVCVPKLKEQEFLSTYMDIERIADERAAAEQKRAMELEQKEKERLNQVNKTGKSEASLLPSPSNASTAAASATDGASANPEALASSPSSSALSPSPSALSVSPSSSSVGETDESKKAPAVVKVSTTIKTSTVVPYSAYKLIGEQQIPDEFVLYRIVLFKRPIDSTTNNNGVIQTPSVLSSVQYPNVERYKTLCRDQRWSVRPFKYDPHEEERSKLVMAQLVHARRDKWEYLMMWCASHYEDTFYAWMHIKAMRTFVESVLRYGLGGDWMAMVIAPNKGYERKLRDALENLYGKDNPGAGKLTGDVEIAGFSSQEFYPYVYIPVDFSDS